MKHVSLKTFYALIILLVFSFDTLAQDCQCGRTLEMSNDGTLACRKCQPEKFAPPAPPPSPSPSANEDLRTAMAQDRKKISNLDEAFAAFPWVDQEQMILRWSSGEKEEDLIREMEAQASSQEITNNPDIEEIGDFLRGVAAEVGKKHAQELEKLPAPLMTEGEAKKLLERQQKFLNMLYEAQLAKGADAVKETDYHRQAVVRMRERGDKIEQSPWSSDLSGMGLIHLFAATAQDQNLQQQLAVLLQEIQQGHHIQVVVTQLPMADGNQQAAGTTQMAMMGVLMPDLLVQPQAGQTDMHLIMGMHPIHINQQTLVAVLMETLQFLARNTEGNTQFTLHFFRCPDSDKN